MNIQKSWKIFAHDSLRLAGWMGAVALMGALQLPAAGLLTFTDPSAELVLQDHEVEVVIEGGYARTTWRQVFANTADRDLEAVYEVPLPEAATLAEVRARLGDRQLDGEVVRKAEAERIYGEEKAAGNDAGLATQEGSKRYRFAIARVPAAGTAELEVVYYQPVPLDLGVGVYRYPLEEGGVDEGAEAFWSRRDTLAGNFSIAVEVRAGAPLAALRAPGFEAGAIEVIDAAAQRFTWTGRIDRLNRDFVLYYQLEEDLPGRVEVFVHKPSPSEPGTFLAIVTPGLDLKPLGGSDYVFVLDISGSMKGKLGILAAGVREALGTLSPADRFRIVLFNNEAEEWTHGWIPATAERVAAVVRELPRIAATGGTNLYAGLREGLARLDADRACSLILVTDAVTNVGVVEPAGFEQLLGRYDLRLFAFVLGNSANWPLMHTICEATGGYARGVSNQQDIVGEILLAQGKVAYQSLHDAQFALGGTARPFDVAGLHPGKIFRGQQLMLLGRYAEAGELELRLDARLTGEAKVYTTRIALPGVEPARPELERLWALRQLQDWDDPRGLPNVDGDELAEARTALAVQYQLVTADTAMLLLEPEQFARHGVERRNAERTAREQVARQTPALPARTDASQPLTTGRAPSFGGGALDLSSLLIAAAVALLASLSERRRRR